jgi:hypothetical protein
MKLVLVAGAIALAFTAAAGGAPGRAPSAPTGLHAFVYRADEPVKSDHTYALMPAFAWKSVTNASNYELQLATSRTFSDATMLYDKIFGEPVASVQVQVPWMTGKPFALWVRVRVVAAGQTSKWSDPFGFNTAWQQTPQRQQSPEGLIRWSTVQGATGYEVWYQNVPTNYQDHFRTLTNVADEREYWTLHPGSAAIVQWRVRAVRLVTSGSLPNGIQVVRYGPYSPVYTTKTSGVISGGKIRPVAAVSNVQSTPTAPSPHQLTPGFAWTGTTDALGHGAGAGYWRVYIFSDKQCVNPVMTSSLIGGPAWAPRDGDPLNLPTDDATLAAFAGGKFPGFGAQGSVFTADGDTPAPAESTPAGGAAGATGSGTPPAAGGSTTPPNGASVSTTVTQRMVSLPDNGWPEGRYWWTVVPVRVQPGSVDPTTGAAGAFEFHDASLPQDLCAARQVWPFGMQSSPVTTTSQTPYASGVGTTSRVVSASVRKPAFRQLPVVTWAPAMAADTYEVELSRHIYPWKAVKKITSVVTSTVLPLDKNDRGTWYYRVRGVNPNLIGPAQKLAWSTPVAVRITGDVFVIVKK